MYFGSFTDATPASKIPNRVVHCDEGPDSASPVPARRRTLRGMTHLLRRLAGLYLLFAVIGRFVEGMGAVECGCSSACWCKRPILSTLRWVFPYGHR